MAKMEATWNWLKMDHPQRVLCSYSSEEFGKFGNSLEDATTCLKSMSEHLELNFAIKVEIAIFDAFYFKGSKVFHAHKEMRAIRRTRNCLKRFCKVHLGNYSQQLLREFWNSVITCKNVGPMYLPTYEMIVYVLLRLLGLSRLMLHTLGCLAETFYCYLQRTYVGHQSELNMLMLANISRLWYLLRAVLFFMFDWYGALKPLIELLKHSPSSVIVDDSLKVVPSDLPDNLAEWLGRENLAFLHHKPVEKYDVNKCFDILSHLETEDVARVVEPDDEDDEGPSMFDVKADVGCVDDVGEVLNDHDVQALRARRSASDADELDNKFCYSKFDSSDLASIATKELLQSFLETETVERSKGNPCVTRGLPDKQWDVLESFLVRRLKLATGPYIPYLVKTVCHFVDQPDVFDTLSLDYYMSLCMFEMPQETADKAVATVKRGDTERAEVRLGTVEEDTGKEKETAEEIVTELGQKAGKPKAKVKKVMTGLKNKLKAKNMSKNSKSVQKAEDDFKENRMQKEQMNGKKGNKSEAATRKAKAVAKKAKKSVIVVKKTKKTVNVVNKEQSLKDIHAIIDDFDVFLESGGGDHGEGGGVPGKPAKGALKTKLSNLKRLIAGLTQEKELEKEGKSTSSKEKKTKKKKKSREADEKLEMSDGVSQNGIAEVPVVMNSKKKKTGKKNVAVSALEDVTGKIIGLVSRKSSKSKVNGVGTESKNGDECSKGLKLNRGESKQENKRSKGRKRKLGDCDQLEVEAESPVAKLRCSKRTKEEEMPGEDPLGDQDGGTKLKPGKKERLKSLLKRPLQHLE